MKIVILTPEQFDKFSFSHPLHTFYQTSMYGNLELKSGYQVFYYGFVDESGNLIGATMLYMGKLFGKYKFAYAPRGFLIDYEDKQLLLEITEKFKRYLSKQKVVFLKIDPPVINNKRDKDGNIIPSEYSNDLIPFLTNNNYGYFGENTFFGTMKPRWNAILKVTGSSETLFKNFEQHTRNKIRKAISRGVEIVQGTHNDVRVFYTFVAKKHHRKLSYYENLASAFGDKFELYFAKLNSANYLKNIKTIYEKEMANNEGLNNEIQKAGLNNNISEKLTNSKITSDKLIATYKNELLQASKLFEENPDGIIIGAAAYIKNPTGMSLLIEGSDKNYNLLYPTYLIKWHVIEKYSKLGAVYFDLNAITGNFSNNNKFRGLNEMKLGFNADIIEYVGEFDLVINQSMYNLYRRLEFLRKNMKSDVNKK